MKDIEFQINYLRIRNYKYLKGEATNDEIKKKKTKKQKPAP